MKQPVRIEEHAPNQEKIIVRVPIYRKNVEIRNKYTTKKGEKYVD